MKKLEIPTRWLTRRRYELVFKGSKGWALDVEDSPASYWMRDGFRNFVLYTVLRHPCCSPPYGSKFWMRFYFPDWLYTAIYQFDNWPLKYWNGNDQEVMTIPLTDAQALALDPVFFSNIQAELAEQEAEDALDVSSDEN